MTNNRWICTQTSVEELKRAKCIAPARLRIIRDGASQRLAPCPVAYLLLDPLGPVGAPPQLCPAQSAAVAGAGPPVLCCGQEQQQQDEGDDERLAHAALADALVVEHGSGGGWQAPAAGLATMMRRWGRGGARQETGTADSRQGQRPHASEANRLFFLFALPPPSKLARVFCQTGVLNSCASGRKKERYFSLSFRYRGEIHSDFGVHSARCTLSSDANCLMGFNTFAVGHCYHIDKLRLVGAEHLPSSGCYAAQSTTPSEPLCSLQSVTSSHQSNVHK